MQVFVLFLVILPQNQWQTIGSQNKRKLSMKYIILIAYYSEFIIFIFFLVLFLHFRRKTRLIKWASVCVCVSVCICQCVCVSVCVSLYSFGPPNNFHTSYAIDTKCWLHIVSYQNSPTPLIPFLNFENCAREKFLKFILSPFY